MTISKVESARRLLNLRTHRLHTLPVLTLMPHSRCNCRCVMCDIWRANKVKRELSVETLAGHVETLRRLHVQWVVLSGGEALMHSNLWRLCELLRQIDIKITLLSTGLLLERSAAEVVAHCDEVIVSLDGDQALHDDIRNVPRAYERLATGVQALRAVHADYPVRARCVVQRRNFDALDRIVQAAHALQLDGISFLAVDVSSTAFNRPDGWSGERIEDARLDRAQARRFVDLAEALFVSHAADFRSGFIAEAPDKLRRMGAYFNALHDDTFPPQRCNAPWMSAVVEADGSVKPCFFHEAYGNWNEQPLDEILNSRDAIAFRRQLDVVTDPICKTCTCTLNFGLRTPAT